MEWAFLAFEELSLAENKLESLPESFGKLISLQKVQQLGNKESSIASAELRHVQWFLPVY